jgi:hypothetical protein
MFIRKGPIGPRIEFGSNQNILAYGEATLSKGIRLLLKARFGIKNARKRVFVQFVHPSSGK